MPPKVIELHKIRKKLATVFMEEVAQPKNIGRMGSKVETAERGDRGYPPDKKLDAKKLFRMDFGRKNSETGTIRMMLQPNKNAEDKEVRRAASNPKLHDLASADWDPKNDPEGIQLRKDISDNFDERQAGRGKTSDTGSASESHNEAVSASGSKKKTRQSRSRSGSPSRGRGGSK